MKKAEQWNIWKDGDVISVVDARAYHYLRKELIKLIHHQRQVDEDRWELMGKAERLLMEIDDD